MSATHLSLANDQATQILELQHVFRTGAPIRGVPQDHKPGFIEKLKLVFDPNFKVTAGGVVIDKAGRWLKFRAVFEQKFTIKKQGRLIGRGFFESDMERMGYEKRELSRLVDSGLLRKVTTSWEKSWRTTYVCLMDVEGVE